jgi:hypothetical protein
MAILGILFAFLLGLGLGVWGTREYLSLASSQRARTILTELQTLRTAQRLNLMAWQTRQAIDDQLRNEGDDR